MGVRGLWKHLCKTSVKYEALCLSSEYRGKTLVVDAMAIFYWLMELLYTTKVRRREYSKYTAIYGGDFNDYRERILGFVEAIQHLEIKPIFFLDGPTYDRQQKLPAQKERYESNLKTIDIYRKVCEYECKTEVKYEKRIKKVLLFRELLQALASVGVEIHICTGEADQEMAQYARDHCIEVCGILTNDTDLILMTGLTSPILHYKLFDCNDILKLRSTRMNKKPHEIRCKGLTSKKIAEHFGISETSLPALAILCGNDFTKQLNEKNGVIGDMFSWPSPNAVSMFIKDHQSACETAKKFLEIEKIKKICERCPKYRHVIEYSYEFYQSAPVILDDFIDDTHAWVTKEVLVDKSLDIFFLSALYGYIWKSEVEQLSRKYPCIYETTLPVRELMYHLLGIDSHIVYEYGQCLDKYTEHIVLVEDLIDSTKLCKLRDLPVKHKLFALFHLFCDPSGPILSPTGICLDVPLDFHLSINTTLTCSCLLFARKYSLIPDEFVIPLLLACFLCGLKKTPPQTTSRPGPITVTIGAQFMVIQQHIRWLASLIGLGKDLPLPSTTFQPFVYIPLHDVVFGIAQRLKFHGELATLKSFYDSLVTKNKCLESLKECICTGSIDNHKFVETVTKFTQTQKWFEEHFEPKAVQRHTRKKNYF